MHFWTIRQNSTIGQKWENQKKIIKTKKFYFIKNYHFFALLDKTSIIGQNSNIEEEWGESKKISIINNFYWKPTIFGWLDKNSAIGQKSEY